MKILIYSDLHLEFGNDFKPPKNSDADLMILAGDIITFIPRGFEQLKEFLKDWNKPVLFVAGNHEFYTKQCMQQCSENFLNFKEENLSHFSFLKDQAASYRGEVEFFGGTMWTDFNKSDPFSMLQAKLQMNDYQQIKRNQKRKLTPEDTVKMHEEFKESLIEFLEYHKEHKRVIISHHLPCLNPNSKHKNSPLQGAYNSLDMLEIIEKYQPDLWVYGHSHECDDQMIGKTRIVSNQFGYYRNGECAEFDPNGLGIEI